MRVEVKFTGGEELARTLNALPTKLSRQIKREALLDAAQPIVTVARRLAPREPGAPDLADNIEAVAGRGGLDTFGDEKATTVAIGPVRGFFYGKFQEFGTVHHAPQPFMRPAWESQRTRTLDLIRERLWVELQAFAHARDVR
jgi:HK97 gp10 family phage protein